MSKIILSLFLLGLSFGSGPCLASCGPILITYIAGTKKNILKSISVYLLFSLARVAVYVVLGILIFLLGRFALERILGGLYRYVLIIGGVFISVAGLLIALGKRLEFGLHRFLQKTILEQDKKSIIILGIVIGLLPCAPLLATLSYIGLISKSVIHSLLYSLAFGLGTVVSPLIILTALAGLIPNFFKEKKVLYAQVFNVICGSILVWLGIGLISRALR